jgi:hypothetical protein
LSDCLKKRKRLGLHSGLKRVCNGLSRVFPYLHPLIDNSDTNILHGGAVVAEPGNLVRYPQIVQDASQLRWSLADKNTRPHKLMVMDAFLYGRIPNVNFTGHGPPTR